MRFVMIMYPGEKAETGALPDPKVFEAMMKYNEDLQRAGALLSGEGFHPSSKGRRISARGGKRTVTTGPFLAARDVIGGFWMIEADSLDAAVEWATRAPLGPDETIEVRQVYELSDFPAELVPSDLAERERALGAELRKKAAGR
jgi:hypothetical protein